MSEEQAREVFSSDPLPAVQTLKFSKSVLRVLEASFSRVDSVGFCPIQNYPTGRKLLFGYHAWMENRVRSHLLPFLNFLGFKHVTRFFSLFLFNLFQLRRYSGSVVILHGLHSPYLLFGYFLMKMGHKAGLIITDESSLYQPSDNKITKVLKKADSFFIKKLVSKYDFGLVLSKGLSTKYLQGKPTLVFPGIVDKSFLSSYESNNECRYPDGIFRILYAGILSSEYGVDNLIDAVLKLDSSVQLCCYGRGDQSGRLETLAKNDPRFFYGGFVRQNELISAIKTCDLLINARPANTRLSQMSFPSKLLEYACTSKPVLTTKLPSIPDDIADFFYYIEGNTADMIASSIKMVQNIDELSRQAKGEALYQQVLCNYSDEGLAVRIKDFLLENKILS